MDARIEKINGEDKKFRISLEGKGSFLAPVDGMIFTYDGKDHVIKKVETVPEYALMWVVTTE